MVASTDSVWLDAVFDTLTGIFHLVGLKTNVRKNMRMVCQNVGRPGYGQMKPITGRLRERGGATVTKRPIRHGGR